MIDDRMLTRTEAAARLGRSYRTILRWIHDGDVQVVDGKISEAELLLTERRIRHQQAKTRFGLSRPSKGGTTMRDRPGPTRDAPTHPDDRMLTMSEAQNRVDRPAWRIYRWASAGLIEVRGGLMRESDLVAASLQRPRRQMRETS